MRQVISVDSNLSAAPNSPLSFDVVYSTADPVDETLTALGLRLHFNSDDLTVGDLSEFNTLATSLSGQEVQDDTDNFDNDDLTDKFILTGWIDPINSAWPGEGTTPATLYTANFRTSQDFNSTTINFTDSTTAAGYELDAPSVTVAKADSPPTVANPLEDITVDEDSEPREIDLSDVFTDPDGDAISVKGSTSNENLVGLSREDKVLTLTFVENANGTAEITVEGTSKDLSATETFEVTVTPVNDAPVIDQTNLTFSIPENSTGEVGTVIVNDVDGGENFSFTISNESNPDGDGDGTRAFAISEGGVITVADRDELNFETTPSFNLEVTATDAGDLSDTATVTVNLTDVDLEQDGGIFNLDAADSNLAFNLISTEDNPVEVSQINQIGIFLFDDASGNIGEFAPEDPGYAAAALERSQPLFSILANNPQGFDAEIKQILNRDDFFSDEGSPLFGLYVTPENTPSLESSDPEEANIFLSNGDNITIEGNQAEGFTLNWQEPGAGESANDIPVKVELTSETNTTANLNTNQILDLSDRTENVTVNLTLTREAAFDNSLIMYEVDDLTGNINDADGNPITDPEDYKAAAQANAKQDTLLTVGDGETVTSEIELEAGKFYAPMLMVKSAETPTEIYTPFAAANSDGISRIISLGQNILGFEDFEDFDFNDMVVEYSF